MPLNVKVIASDNAITSNINRCLSPLEASILSQIAITDGTVLLGMK